MRQISFLVRQFDAVWYFVWTWLSGVFAAKGIDFGKRALAHYVALRTGKRFAVRKLDTNIYIVMARVNASGIALMSSIFAENIEKAITSFEKHEGATVVEYKNLAQWRHETVAALDDEEVKYL